MTPLLVTAYTPSGFACSDPWSPSLDGLLAYWLLREQLGEEEFALGMSGQRPLVTPNDLPLELVRHDDQWWWACSSPIVERHGEFLHYYHRRFDAMQAERFLLTGKSGRILTRAGPYKAYRLVNRVVVTPQVQWHCIGDEVEIRRLLRLCRFIGAGSTRGLGMVMRWEIRSEGANERLARYGRPLPVDYAHEHDIDGPLLEWGIRPPGRLLENRCLCVMPGGEACELQ